jgi:hypothetical protein
VAAIRNKKRAKGTRVNGVCDKDPLRHDDAIPHPEISYHDVLAKTLKGVGCLGGGAPRRPGSDRSFQFESSGTNPAERERTLQGGCRY